MFMECSGDIKVEANDCSPRAELLPDIRDFGGWKDSELFMSKDHGQVVKLHNVGTR